MSDQTATPAAPAPSATTKILDRVDTTSIIALLLVLSFITISFILVLRSPESDMTKMVVGALIGTGFASIVGYYFGSSTGSKAKDAALMPPPDAKP